MKVKSAQIHNTPPVNPCKWSTEIIAKIYRSESDACRHALIPSLAVSAAALVDRLTGLEVSTVLSSASKSAWLEILCQYTRRGISSSVTSNF